MAKVTLKIHNKSEVDYTDIYDIDLNQMTNNELISQLIYNQIIIDDLYETYKVVGKNYQLVDDPATLVELGFKNGDVINILYRIYN